MYGLMEVVLMSLYYDAALCITLRNKMPPMNIPTYIWKDATCDDPCDDTCIVT